MRILFDGYGSQIEVQMKTSDRLQAFLDAINAVDGWNYGISSGALSTDALEGYDVLVLTTRMWQGFTTDELSAIITFVQTDGNGLWCMANHAPFNNKMQNGQSQLNNNHVRYTSAVASTFFSSYEAAAYSAKTGDTSVPLTGSNLGSQEIISGNNNWPLYGSNTSSKIKTVVTRSFFGIYPNHFGHTIAALAGLDNVINYQDNAPITSGVLWAIALDGDHVTGTGRVVICADSGWIANTQSRHPGPGEFQNGDNPQFALNTLSWLAQL